MKSDKDIMFKPLPRHIGFIMDGNGRWAKKRLLPRKVGHKAGVETLKSTVKAVYALGIPYVSVYAFSTENDSRPDDEKQALFSLIGEYFSTSLDYFIENGVRVRFMGDLSYFPESVRAALDAAEKRSAELTAKVLNIGLNYGARAEIVRAVNLAVERGERVTEKEFGELLYTNGMPPPDLIVRTGGESRLSNFMLYQAAYSELIFTPVLWPDFKEKELHEALAEYERRDRRFGSIKV